MNWPLRIFLLVCALAVFIYVIVKVRKSKIQVSDTVFWTLFCGLLVLLAIFPQVIYWCSKLVGIESPANFVFFCTIGLLLIRILVLNMRLANLKCRFEELVQKIAIDEHENNAAGKGDE